jgi:hypothetical protein
VSSSTNPTSQTLNRRASRRAPLRGTVRVECRKGSMGLGANLVHAPLDISETGVRLILKVDVRRGQEVEILITGGGFTKPVKKIGAVIWSLPTENSCYCVGVRFDGSLGFADLQNLTRPPRIIN